MPRKTHRCERPDCYRPAPDALFCSLTCAAIAYAAGWRPPGAPAPAGRPTEPDRPTAGPAPRLYDSNAQPPWLAPGNASPVPPPCPDCGALGGGGAPSPFGIRWECITPNCATVTYYTDPDATPIAPTPRLLFARWLVQTGRLTEYPGRTPQTTEESAR